MNEDNVNITLFCLDHAQEYATKGLTKEQIADARLGLLIWSMNDLLQELRQNLSPIGPVDKGMDKSFDIYNSAAWSVKA